MKSASEFEIGGHSVPPGERRDLELAVSQSYTGVPIALPLTVWRAEQPGPVVGVTATLHGDELNGIGVIRELITAPPFELQAGILVLAPVLNVLGFERHSRYLPDRRDLNRCFPGIPDGSPASRFAHAIFREIAMGCDHMIDLHTAAARRTNFPNVRADLKDAGARRLAVAFGCELIVHGKGPGGSLRRSACAAGRPAIILEAGEVGKIETGVVECGVRGVRNVLIELGMVAGVPVRPAYQVRIQKTTWVRADRGGLLQFHVAPGDLVESGQPLATNSNLHGRELNVMHAPDDGVVLGMTTLPAVTPGDAVFHLAVLPEGAGAVKKTMRDRPEESLHERLRDDLATSVAVSEPSPDSPSRPEQATD